MVFLCLAPVFNTRPSIWHVFIVCHEETGCTLKSAGTMFHAGEELFLGRCISLESVEQSLSRKCGHAVKYAPFGFSQ